VEKMLFYNFFPYSIIKIKKKRKRKKTTYIERFCNLICCCSFVGGVRMHGSWVMGASFLCSFDCEVDA
jgi:hypothetical protein